MTLLDCFVCLSTALALCNIAFAADESPLDAASLVRDRGQALVEKKGVLGLAVGVIQGDRSHVVTAGQWIVGSPPPDENTVFEIGSISKTFTALLLADAVVRGEVRLDQPVAELLGPDAVVPQYEGQPIRLVDLATQTSGLPRLPTNLRMINPFNPYAQYKVDDLNKFLGDYKLPRAPGEQYEYSNFGAGLLGHALALRAGKSYEQLVRERICQPLGMSETTIALSKEQQRRLAGGISMFGLPAMNWDMPTLAGAGGLRSTLKDMLIYTRANLSPDTTPLAAAIRLAQEPRFTIHEPTKEEPYKLEIGLAWHVTTRDGVSITWHNGMTGGYASYLGLVPEKKIGIIVLANTASSKVDKFAIGVLNELCKGD